MQILNVAHKKKTEGKLEVEDDPAQRKTRKPANKKEDMQTLKENMKEDIGTLPVKKTFWELFNKNEQRSK